MTTDDKPNGQSHPVTNPTRVDGGHSKSSVTVTIAYDLQTREVSINGPVTDPLLFYGILKLAEKCYDNLQRQVREAAEKANRPRIHTV